MEEEDDYDLDDELEQALADDDDAEPASQAPGLPKGPGLPTGPGTPTGAGLPQPSSAAQEDTDMAEPSEAPEPSRASGSDAEEAEVEPEAETRPAEDAEEQAREDEALQKQALLEMMNEDQLNRYEAFRRSALPRKSMRRLLQAVTGQNPNLASAGNTTIVLCSIAKMFVGELIEEAREIAAREQNFGPLQPAHVHEAYQRLQQGGRIKHSVPTRRRL